MSKLSILSETAIDLIKNCFFEASFCLTFMYQIKSPLHEECFLKRKSFKTYVFITDILTRSNGVP